jgi:hypothetical protein
MEDPISGKAILKNTKLHGMFKVSIKIKLKVL